MRTMHSTILRSSPILLALASTAVVHAQTARVFREHIPATPTAIPLPLAGLGPTALEPQVELLGDLDSDDVNDYLLTYPTESITTGTSLAGVARAYSGATGALIWEIEGEASWQLCTGALQASDLLGASAAALGDVTGDGTADVAIGSPGAGTLLPGDDCPVSTGEVLIVSGKDGVIFQVLSGSAEGELFGWDLSTLSSSLVPAPPTAGNLLVLAPFGPNPRVVQFDDTNWAPFFIHDTFVSSPNDALLAVQDGGDADGDGSPDFATTVRPESALVPNAVVLTDSVSGAMAPGVLGRVGSRRFGHRLAVHGGAFGAPGGLVFVSDPGNFGAPLDGWVSSIDFTAPVPTEIRLQSGPPGFAEYISAGGDFDADGMPDVIVAGSTSGPGLGAFEWIPDPGSGASPVAFNVAGATDSDTMALGFVGDPLGRGHDDIAFIEYDHDARLLSGGASASVNTAYGGGGCQRAPGQAVAALGLSPGLTPGMDFSFQLDLLAGYDFAVIGMDFAPLGAFGPATPTVIPSSCISFVGATPQILVDTGFLAGATSWTSPQLTFPTTPSLVGTSIAFQAFLFPLNFGIGQISTSNAVAAVVGW